MTEERTTIIVNFKTPGAEVLVLGRGHISNISENALSFTLSIYSTLIAIVLRDCNANILFHCWFLFFFLWWDCWYANMSSLTRVSVESLILSWLLRPLVGSYVPIGDFRFFIKNLPKIPKRHITGPDRVLNVSNSNRMFFKVKLYWKISPGVEGKANVLLSLLSRSIQYRTSYCNGYCENESRKYRSKHNRWEGQVNLFWTPF